eukprot:3602380-Prorocentrum_lima.AAC.1
MNSIEYTNVQVPVSEGMIPHGEANNIGPSWTISMGDVHGGLLWVESREGRTLPPIHSTRIGTK